MKKLNLWEINEEESELFYIIVNNYKGKMKNHSDKPLDLPSDHKLLLTGNILVFSDSYRLPQVLRKEKSYSPYAAPFSTSFKKGRLNYNVL